MKHLRTIPKLGVRQEKLIFVCPSRKGLTKEVRRVADTVIVRDAVVRGRMIGHVVIVNWRGRAGHESGARLRGIG